MLYIITPCSRIQWLKQVYRSMSNLTVPYKWIILIDEYGLDKRLENGGLDKAKAFIYDNFSNIADIRIGNKYNNGSIMDCGGTCMVIDYINTTVFKNNDYIFVCNDDNKIHKNLNKMVHLAEENNVDLIAFSAEVRFDNGTYVMNVIHDYHYNFDKIHYGVDIAQLLFKATTVQQFKMERWNYTYDWEIWERMNKGNFIVKKLSIPAGYNNYFQTDIIYKGRRIKKFCDRTFN